jgi:2Fe-2S ferredoxin
MPKIKLAKSGRILEAPMGANLFHFLNDNGVPVASSCGGEVVCTKCLIKVIEGSENLSHMNELESDMRDIYDTPKNYRMSCQTFVNGDITIDTEYW